MPILHATVHILPELSVKGLFSVRNDIRNIDYFKKHYSYGSGSNIADSGLREGYDKYYIWNEYTSQLLVNYNKSFQKHTIGALFGFEQWEQIYKYTEATRKGGGSDELTESLNTLDKSSQTNSDGGTELAAVHISVVSNMIMPTDICLKQTYVQMHLHVSRKIIVGVYSLLFLPDGESQKRTSLKIIWIG